jgi:hypothetical protein
MPRCYPALVIVLGYVGWRPLFSVQRDIDTHASAVTLVTITILVLWPEQCQLTLVRRWLYMLLTIRTFRSTFRTKIGTVRKQKNGYEIYRCFFP